MLWDTHLNGISSPQPLIKTRFFWPLLAAGHVSKRSIWSIWSWQQSNSLTQCHRRSPNVAVKCHSRMELRPPTARKSHPNFFAHCKRKILDRAGWVHYNRVAWDLPDPTSLTFISISLCKNFTAASNFAKNSCKTQSSNTTDLNKGAVSVSISNRKHQHTWRPSLHSLSNSGSNTKVQAQPFPAASASGTHVRFFAQPTRKGPSHLTKFQRKICWEFEMSFPMGLLHVLAARAWGPKKDTGLKHTAKSRSGTCRQVAIKQQRVQEGTDSVDATPCPGKLQKGGMQHVC